MLYIDSLVKTTGLQNAWQAIKVVYKKKKMTLTDWSTFASNNLYQWIYSTEYDRSYNRKFNTTESRDEQITSSTPPQKQKTMCTAKEVNTQPAGILKSVNALSVGKNDEITVKTGKTQHMCKKKKKHSSSSVGKRQKSLKKSGKDKIVSGDKENMKKSDKVVKSSAAKEFNRNGETYNLSLVAGKCSSTYERSPFMQKKKRVSHMGDCLMLGTDQAYDGYLEKEVVLNRYVRSDTDIADVAYRSEPSLQKKKIALYTRNHNIMRTNTIEESAKQGDRSREGVITSEVVDEPVLPKRRKSCLSLRHTPNLLVHKPTIQRRANFELPRKPLVKEFSDLSTSRIKKIMSKYQVRKTFTNPGIYQSSYDLHYCNDHWKEESPLINADRRKSAPVENTRQHVCTYAEKPASKPCAEDTEYKTEFCKPETAEKSYAPQNYDDKFVDYYNRMLEDRFFAYHPALLERIGREKEVAERSMKDAELNSSENEIREKIQNKCRTEKARKQGKSKSAGSSTDSNDEKNLSHNAGKDVDDRSSNSTLKKNLLSTAEKELKRLTSPHKALKGGRGSDLSLKPKKSSTRSVCSTCSYDTRYSLTYDPSVYSSAQF